MRLDLLAGTATATVTKRFYQDGTLTDGGAVTYTVTGPGGAVVATGAATQGGVGIYSFTLTAAMLAAPTWLRITWVRALGGTLPPADTIEVNEGVLFNETDARGAKIVGGQAPLADATAYPDAVVAAARLRITDLFEAKTGRSWVPRYCRVIAAGDGTDVLPLWRGRPATVGGGVPGGHGWSRDVLRVLSATVDGVSVPAADIAIGGGSLWRTSGTWPMLSTGSRYPVILEYVYGQDPVPYAAHVAGLQMLLKAIPSNISAWAQSVTNEDGSFQFDPPYPRDVFEFLRSNDSRVQIA